MRPAGTLLQVAVCLSSLAPLTAAWPDWLPARDSVVVRHPEVIRRADDSTASETASASKASATKDSSDAKTTDFNTANLNTAVVETGTNTDESDSTETGKSSGKKTTKKNKSAAATHTSYNNLDPAGGVSLQTPVTTVQPTPLYKIGDYVTFGWNYTSLQGTPTAIDVLVSCSSKTETWTLTQNMTFATKVSYVWNTEKDGGVDEKPLAVELYTLIIKDSDASITDIADSGYLQSYTGLKFGLYTPLPYTPLSEWKCVGCNAASSLFNGQAFGLALTMSIITIASFTWFVTGLGLQ